MEASDFRDMGGGDTRGCTEVKVKAERWEEEA